MKRTVTISLKIAVIIVLCGWGNQESNIAGEKKHNINFYGTLETWANPKIKIGIENISIDNLFKQIPMYIKPTINSKKSEKAAISNSAYEAAKAAKAAAKAADTAAKMTKKGDCSAALEVAKAAQAAAKAATEAARAIGRQVPISKTTKANEHILSDNPRTSLIESKIDLFEIGKITIPNPNEIWSYRKEKGYRKYEYIELVTISKGDKRTKTHYLIDKRKKVYCDRITNSGPEEMEVPLKAIKELLIESYKDRQKYKTEEKKSAERIIIKKLSKQKSKN